MPDKYPRSLADQEMRYRQRYVDLIVNEESRTVFPYALEDHPFHARNFMEASRAGFWRSKRR